MNRHLLLLVLPFVAVPQLRAQVWCPPGATWYYTDSSYVSGTPGYRILEYVQDTVINGQPAQQMSNTWYRLIAGILDPLSSFKFHTYQDGGVVYCKTELSGPWDTLYVFDAVPGDHWHFAHFSDSDPCDRVTVTDTGHVMIAGYSLRYVDYEHDSSGVVVTRRITERFGDSYSFWPQPQCGMNEVKRGLRCYMDNELGLVSTGLVPACDFTNSVQEMNASTAWRVLPNPGRDGFRLQAPPGLHKLVIHDAEGRVAMEGTTSQGNWWDASKLAPGIYLVRMPEAGIEMRWIKQ